MVTLKPLYMAGESVLVTQSGPILCNPMDCAHQAPLSMGFSRQEYRSGLPCLYGILIPPPRDEPELPAMEEQSLNCQTANGSPFSHFSMWF